jgi:hypothetical protein
VVAELAVHANGPHQKLKQECTGLRLPRRFRLLRPPVQTPRRHAERRRDVTHALARSPSHEAVRDGLLPQRWRVPPANVTSSTVLSRRRLLKSNEVSIHQSLLVVRTVNHSLVFG